MNNIERKTKLIGDSQFFNEKLIKAFKAGFRCGESRHVKTNVATNEEIELDAYPICENILSDEN